MNNLNNIIEYTVSELNHSIKKIMEGSFNYLKVKGEISQIKKHNSGHIYLTLKDNNETISCVCWRTNVRFLKSIPLEGQNVEITGKVSVYSPQSKYQIIIDKIEDEGEGNILKRLEILKKKLLDEGLFEKKHKLNLPLIPEKIGVITSESGVVFRDIVHRIENRFPTHLILFPVNVQGKECVNQIINMLDIIEEDRFGLELIIIARGGGSMEDLMAFNDEKLVRKLYKFPIPIISAIGHETDTTLCDFVSDLRAPTPTAAAEFAVPVKQEYDLQVQQKSINLKKLVRRKLEYLQSDLKNISLQLITPNAIIEKNYQTLDIIEIKLKNFLISIFKEKHANLKIFSDYLNFYDFKNKFLLIYEKMKNTNLLALISEKTELYKLQINEKKKLLESLSYKKILKRGFSVIRKKNRIIKKSEEIATGDIITIEFSDSKIDAKKL